MHDHHLQKLKLYLQTFGSVRPEAWTLLVYLPHFTKVNKDESFTRKLGAFAWLASAILKEYNNFAKEKPAVINFLIPNDGLITRKLNAT